MPLPPQPQPTSTQRRHQLAIAVNLQQDNQEAAAPAVPPKPLPKTPGLPPLLRQNSKATPPYPPKVITDMKGRLQFNRVGFLGEGVFARVYEVEDPGGSRLACKVVTKASLKTKKAKAELYVEIKIHRSLEHPNIVNFQECFEDTDNVYMTLELCPSGSLMDMHRRRRRLTEPEARFFMVQLIGACHYMHTHQVIHRDLTLGNLFLDVNMNVKVGDFGLAALINDPGKRRKTICGTPNYIAPEVLLDIANGYSFEVDTWSIGIILYTLVVGRLPFQNKDIKTIYKRIRDNRYEFPTQHVISSAVRNLIQEILTPNPSERPTLHEIVDHAFFTQGTVPSYIPTSAHDLAPDFRHITMPASDSNLKRLRKYSLLDVDYNMMPSSLSLSGSVGSGTGVLVASKGTTNSIAQQDAGAAGAADGMSLEDPVLRKLHVVKEGLLERKGLEGVVEENHYVPNGRRRMMDNGEHEQEEMRLRTKELEAQKAGIVAQMVHVKENGNNRHDMEEDEMELVKVKPREKVRERERYGENITPAPAAMVLQRSTRSNRESLRATKTLPVNEVPKLPVNLTNRAQETQDEGQPPPSWRAVESTQARTARPSLSSPPNPPLTSDIALHRGSTSAESTSGSRSPSVYSHASSRTQSTNYGVFYRRMAISDDEVAMKTKKNQQNLNPTAQHQRQIDYGR